ncbi:tail fiber assembly protein [Citrobacter sp. Cb025]|uniref:tail fiber assembly protein n=1 Tax=Citrobacter TaxID=544 RepID=UPI0010788822|nr:MULTISPECIES: tail fiber assembly protein [Citrobacter]MDM3420031.1 tail fiber assembly protein [Citrobacter sp. Cb025]
MTKSTFLYHDGLFYPDNIQYNEIPHGALEVSENEYKKAVNRAPGESFIVNENGIVTITPPPPPSKEQLKKNAEIKKKELLDSIVNITSMMRTELMLGTISDEGKNKLAHYVSLYKEIESIDTDNAPDEWPEIR